MKKIFLLFGLILMVAFSTTNAQTVRQIKLNINQQKSLDKNTSIKFVSVINDSRCPVDVECVWAGNAELKIALTKNGRTSFFELNTGLKPQTIVFRNYRIKILKLAPERSSKSTKLEYSAIFEVNTK